MNESLEFNKNTFVVIYSRALQLSMWLMYCRSCFSSWGTGGYRPCESCDLTRANCLIYLKSGNVVKKSGKYRENYQQNRENRELSYS